MAAPDVTAVADGFRVSPWTAEEVWQGLAEFVMTDLVRWAVLVGVAPIIWVSIDDSLTRKDEETTHPEAVDVVHAHAAAGKARRPTARERCTSPVGCKSASGAIPSPGGCTCGRRRCGGSTGVGPRDSAWGSGPRTNWRRRCWKNCDRICRKATKSMSCSTAGMRRAS